MEKTYGLLTIIKQVENDKNGNITFECKCECGNLKRVTKSKLMSGHTKSCGCLKYKVIDIVGLKKERLEVISFSHTTNDGSCWVCKCQCGNIITLSKNRLLNKHTKSCGCLNMEVRAKHIKEKAKFFNGTSITSISNNQKANKNNTCGHKGVHYDKKRERWVAQIYFKGKQYNLGRYDTMSEAIDARKEAERDMFDPVIEEYKKSIQ